MVGILEGNTEGVDPRLLEMTQAAWSALLPGARVVVSTGVSNHSPTNHAPGHAVDFAVYDPSGNMIPTSDPRWVQASQLFRAMGGHGIGFGDSYMGGQYAHWDISANGPRSWNDSSGDGGWSSSGAADYNDLFLAAGGMTPEELLASFGAPDYQLPQGGFPTFAGERAAAPMAANMPNAGMPQVSQRTPGIIEALANNGQAAPEGTFWDRLANLGDNNPTFTGAPQMPVVQITPPPQPAPMQFARRDTITPYMRLFQGLRA